MSLHVFNNVSLSLLLWGHVLKKATLEEEQFLEGEGGAFWKETTLKSNHFNGNWSPINVHI